jgi:hypothetical protein
MGGLPVQYLPCMKAGSLAKRLRWVGLLTGLAGLTACSGDPRAGQYVGDIITAIDFEQLAGWGSTDLTALTQQQAHSGRMATFVGPGREFSLTYHLPLGQASVHTLKAVEVDAWVYLPSGKADALLAIQVQHAPVDSGAILYDAQLRLLDQVHAFGSWQRVHKVFILPWDLPGDAELRIFLWRSASAEPVYLDDLTVKARE